MVYEEFLTTIKDELHARLGDSHNVFIQKVQKNNGTQLDGLCVSKQQDRIAPTLYLNSYYEQLKAGASMNQILEELLNIFSDSSTIPHVNPEILSDFSHLKTRVAYKLIHTDSNRELLRSLPSIPYLDLSMVFYLFLEENEYGHMTALIHNSHMASWGTTTEELYHLAAKNTSLLMPGNIKDMEDVMKEVAKAQLGEEYLDAFIDDLLIPDDAPPLYILSNDSGLNGACAILYENLLKNFADSLEQDLIILPSSIHEVLLIPYTEDISIPELFDMVRHINLTEVPVEDRLSDQIYFFDRGKNLTTLISRSPEQQTS